MMTPEQRKECWQRNSFGGVNVISALALFREGRLVTVYFTFRVSDFEILSGAAKERLGEPTRVVDSIVQNRAGAKFENRLMTWERQSMALNVQRYSSTIDKGGATLTTPEERDRFAAEQEALKKKSAKDF